MVLPDRVVVPPAIELAEPMTTITDWLLAAICLVCAVRVGLSIGSENRVTGWFWCGAFVATAVAAMAGGAWHGLAGHLDAGTRQAIWNLVMFSIGAACAFMTAGIHAAHVRRRDGTVQWFVLAILTTLLGVALQRGRFPNIRYFNHNDAFHVTQMVALYFYYRCARSVRDRPDWIRTADVITVSDHTSHQDP